MGDLEREIRETLLRHEANAPAFDASDARRAAGSARRRQLRNTAVGGIAGSAAAIAMITGLGGLMRADPPPTVLDRPPPSATCVAMPKPEEVVVLGWPRVTRNPAGVYSWDTDTDRPNSNEGWMHNAYKPGSGRVEIAFEGFPGQLTPHAGGTAATVAGCEATYRRFVAELDGRDGLLERWMVDLQGTTVTITVTAKPGARKAEVAEAHEIVESIRMESADNDLGFQLVFTLTTDTWDSG